MLQSAPTIIDPAGAWWGIRSSADAKGEGLPVVIFGGEHGDVPRRSPSRRALAHRKSAGGLRPDFEDHEASEIHSVDLKPVATGALGAR